MPQNYRQQNYGSGQNYGDRNQQYYGQGDNRNQWGRYRQEDDGGSEQQYRSGEDRDRYETGDEQRYSSRSNERYRGGRAYEGDRSYSSGGYPEEFGHQRDYVASHGFKNERDYRGSGRGDYSESRYGEGRYSDPWQSRDRTQYSGGGGSEGSQYQRGDFSDVRNRPYGDWTRAAGYDWRGYEGRGGSEQGGYHGTENYGRSLYGAYGTYGQQGSFSDNLRDYGPDYPQQSQQGWRGQQQGMQSGGQRSQWQGAYRGRGPKGYTRSDERLKEVICERLTDDPHIDASDITIEVHDQVVKLTGTVDDRRCKYEVEELIERIGGVKDIDNQLRVQSQSQGQSRGGAEFGSSNESGSNWSATGSSSGSRGTERSTGSSTTSGASSTSGTSGTSGTSSTAPSKRN